MYGGGPIVVGRLAVFGLFYGTWALQDPRVGYTANLVGNIAKTSYWNSVRKYTSTKGPATADVLWAGSALVPPVYGMNWTTDYTFRVVTDAIASGMFTNGTDLYFVFLSADVFYPSMCNSICGYHAYDGATLYSMVGDPASCGSTHVNGRYNACSYFQSETLPSAATIVHELVEVITDPFFTAYGGNMGNNYDEAADVCEWTYAPYAGSTSGYQVTNGTFWNKNVNSVLYLLQPVYDPSLHICTLDGFAPPTSGQSSVPQPSIFNITSQLPWWVWVLVAITAVALCTCGVALLCLCLHRRVPKKKKKATNKRSLIPMIVL